MRIDLIADTSGLFLEGIEDVPVPIWQCATKWRSWAGARRARLVATWRIGARTPNLQLVAQVNAAGGYMNLATIAPSQASGDVVDVGPWVELPAALQADTDVGLRVLTDGGMDEAAVTLYHLALEVTP